jgi:hypothetical protein
MAIGQSGRINTRSTQQVAHTWTERFVVNTRSVNGSKLIAVINEFWRLGTIFTITHLDHLTPLGTGTGTVTVSGASQTGSTLVTTGWGGSTPYLRAGDIIKVAGVLYVLEITADATSGSLGINPPIFTGGSPSNGAAVTYTGVTLDANIVSPPDLPKTTGASADYGDITVTFAEAL